LRRVGDGDAVIELLTGQHGRRRGLVAGDLRSDPGLGGLTGGDMHLRFALAALLAPDIDLDVIRAFGRLVCLSVTLARPPASVFTVAVVLPPCSKTAAGPSRIL